MNRETHLKAVGACLALAIAVIVAGLCSSCSTPTPGPSPSPSPESAIWALPTPRPSPSCRLAPDGCNTICCNESAQCTITDLYCVPKQNPAPMTGWVEGSCGFYKWKDRSRAPAGFIEGMVRAYSRSYCRWRSNETTVAGLTGKQLGSADRDALVHMGIGIPVGKAPDYLLATWALGFGLGMRESSGKYCEGRDMSATNVKADTAEAGTFQASYNSRGIAPDRLNGLWAWYRAHPEHCDLDVWKQGVDANHKSCRPEVAGSGPGASWQEFSRRCPAFAAEWAMVLVRNLKNHFGPLKRREAEYRPECEALLLNAKRAIDEEPELCEEFL